MLRAGDRLTLCTKVMGRRHGEPLVRIVDVEVISVRRERLDAITMADAAAEGFPEMTDPTEFVDFFCGTHKGCRPDSEVTRIEWRYLDDPPSPGDAGLPETETGSHPGAAGIERVRLHRLADGAGDIIAADQGAGLGDPSASAAAGTTAQDLAGAAARAEDGSRTRQGRQADQRAAHPSLTEGPATWRRTAREPEDSLTGLVRSAGPRSE
jgi:hypothetical protein